MRVDTGERGNQHAAQGSQRHTHGKYQRVQANNVDTQGLRHVAVEGACTDFHAQLGFADEQPQAQSQGGANRQHEQAVSGVRQGVSQSYGPI